MIGKRNSLKKERYQWGISKSRKKGPLSVNFKGGGKEETNQVG